MLKYRMNTLLFESVEALIERVDGEVIPIGDIVLTNTITKKQIIIKNTPKNIVEVKKPISILDLPNEVMDVILNFANQKEYLIKTFLNENKIIYDENGSSYFIPNNYFTRDEDDTYDDEDDSKRIEMINELIDYINDINHFKLYISRNKIYSFDEKNEVFSSVLSNSKYKSYVDQYYRDKFKLL